MTFSWLLPMLVMPFVVLLTLPLPAAHRVVHSLLGYMLLALGAFACASVVYVGGPERGVSRRRSLFGIALSLLSVFLTLTSAIGLHFAPDIIAELKRRKQLAIIEQDSGGFPTARSDYVIPRLEKPVALEVDPSQRQYYQPEDQKTFQWQRISVDAVSGVRHFKGSQRIQGSFAKLVRGKDSDEVYFLDNPASFGPTSPIARLDLRDGTVSHVGPKGAISVCHCSVGTVFVMGNGTIVLCDQDKRADGIALKIPSAIRHKLGRTFPDGKNRLGVDVDDKHYHGGGVIHSFASPNSPLVYLVQNHPRSFWVCDLQARKLVGHATLDRLWNKKFGEHHPGKGASKLWVSPDGDSVLMQQDSKFISVDKRRFDPVVSIEVPESNEFRVAGFFQSADGYRFTWMRIIRPHLKPEARVKPVARVKTDARGKLDLVDPTNLGRGLQSVAKTFPIGLVVATKDYLAVSSFSGGANQGLIIYRVSDWQQVLSIHPRRLQGFRWPQSIGGNRLLLKSGFELYVLDLDTMCQDLDASKSVELPR